MTNDSPDDPTRPVPPGSSPYDQPSPWSTPPAGSSSGSSTGASTGDMPPPQPYGSPSGQQQPSDPYGPPPGQPSGAPQYGAPQYGQQYGQPYGQQPGQPPYGGQPYPPSPYGYGHSPEGTQVRSSATLWLILNIASVILWGWALGGLLGIVGAIFAGLAMGRADTDTADARHKVRLAKIFFWVGLGLAIAVVVIGIIGLVALGSRIDTNDPTFGTGV